jgi:hypothetical protein
VYLLTRERVRAKRDDINVWGLLSFSSFYGVSGL